MTLRLTVDERWRVHAEHQIAVPHSASVVWGQMRDLRSFLTLDPLHREVRWQDEAARAIPCVGSTLIIEHRLMGIGPDRVGRLLQWREGRGFAISDLSKRGVRVGFPHVCAYTVEPRQERGSVIRVTVRGRWTAIWMPRILIKLWLWWVMCATGLHIASFFACLRQPAKRRSN